MHSPAAKRQRLAGDLGPLHHDVATPSSSSTSRGPAADTKCKLGVSLAETKAFLRRERPHDWEDIEIGFAMRRSLLDQALEAHRGAPELSSGDAVLCEDKALKILGLATGASASEIRSASRTKALAAHPDKGG